MLKYFLYKLGRFIALKLPLSLGYWLAVFISDARYIFASEDRANVTANLKVIFPEKSERQIKRIRKQMFRNFAKYLVDFFRFATIDEEYIRKNVRLENMNYYTEALSRGKGVIALTAHLGNLELGGVVIAQLKYPFYAVALPHKTKKEDDFFNFQRQMKGVKVIPLGKAVRQCLNALKKNAIVALAGDRDFTEKGIVLDFFGKPAFFPEGAAAFSLQTGAVIVPGFMVRNPDDTFTLRMEKPLEYIAQGKKDEDIKALVNQYKTIIQDYIRRFPDQWYMFKKFWINEATTQPLS